MSSLLEVKGLSRCITTKTAKPQTKWLIQGRGVEESDPSQVNLPLHLDELAQDSCTLSGHY